MSKEYSIFDFDPSHVRTFGRICINSRRVFVSHSLHYGADMLNTYGGPSTGMFVKHLDSTSLGVMGPNLTCERSQLVQGSKPLVKWEPRN